MNYQLLTSGVLRLDDNTYIPNDPRNTDWQGYQDWLAAGNTPLPQYDLAATKANKAQAISVACAAAITGGQQSSALGSVHTYPTMPLDQQNLNASITDSLLPVNASNPNYITPFWCATADANGNLTWAWTAHTAAQIQQAGMDIKAAILAAQNKNASLQDQIAAATTIDQVNAITW